jgi:TatD DNase family protein
MTAWTDAHNHLHDPRLGDPVPIITAMRTAGVERCIVNATRQDDWPALEALALAAPDFVFPAFGVHPWQAHTATPGWQERLARLLENHPHAAIGECGLDRRVASPPMTIQRRVFREQLRLARDLRRPLSIHCLHAWGPLLESLAEAPPPACFLMHAFGGSIETARRLIPLGACFSFSGHFLDARQAAVLEMYRQLPRDRILLETDAPDMRPPAAHVSHDLPGKLNHPANLAAIGRALAEALLMSPGDLARLTRDNAARCFGL